MDLQSAQLVLKTGETFSGLSPSYLSKPCLGEVVFNTGMVGYVESITDPSYSGQILVFTYPLLGNYGVTGPSTWESERPCVSAVVMSELAAHYSNPVAEQSLYDWLNQYQIPFLVGADTRAITIRLRRHGVIPGALLKQGDTTEKFEEFDNINWVQRASIKKAISYGSGDKHIIMVDCGIKENIIRSFADFPLSIKRVPYDYDYSEEHFDGVFLSNGPGDPKQCEVTVGILKKALKKEKPIFGICLGTQLLALAVGANTYKLPFGHRSHNQPCMNLATGRCYLTSQNHSYAVDEKTLPPDWRVTFRNLNDQSVEGIAHRSLPFFAVQFHPEAAPGPMDTQWLFQRFYEML